MYKKLLLPGAALLAGILLSTRPAMAADDDIPKLRNSFFFVGAESFLFTEYDGRTAISEDKGVRGTVGIAWSNLFVPSGGAVYRAAITGYAGLPSYECIQASSASLSNLCDAAGSTSEARYVGVKIDGLGGYRFGSKIGVEVFSGVTLDFWNRSVTSGTITGGGASVAYDTYNAVGSFKLGASLLQRFNSFGYFLRAGLKAPFVAWQRIDIFDGVEVSPGLQMAAFANLDLTFGTLPRDRFVISLYYDSMNLARSSPSDLYDNGTYTGVALAAPASKMSAVGAQMIFGF